jgi:hypothetical protein
MSRKRNGFDVLALRRHEIERLARHTGVAETDDLPEVLRVWAQQNPHSKDPTNALIYASQRMAGRTTGGITEEEAGHIIEEANTTRVPRSADAVAVPLGLKDAMRTALDIRAIGSIDVNSRQRAVRRKKRNRMHNQSKRRARGVRSRAEYLAEAAARPRPWEAKGISRATWYRRGGAASRETHSGLTVPQAPPVVNGTTPFQEPTVVRLPLHGLAPSAIVETGCVSNQDRKQIADRPRLTGEGGNADRPRLTGNGHDAAPAPEAVPVNVTAAKRRGRPSLGAQAMTVAERKRRERSKRNGDRSQDALPDRPPELPPAEVKLCAHCGEPGNVLNDSLMRDRHGRLVHRACRDETGWSVPQGRSLH